MKRKLFPSVAALSVLLCAATAALWVRSYARQDRIWLGHANWGGVTGISQVNPLFGDPNELQQRHPDPYDKYF